MHQIAISADIDQLLTNPHLIQFLCQCQYKIQSVQVVESSFQCHSNTWAYIPSQTIPLSSTKCKKSPMLHEIQEYYCGQINQVGIYQVGIFQSCSLFSTEFSVLYLASQAHFMHKIKKVGKKRMRERERKSWQIQCAGDVATAAAVQQAVFDSLQFKHIAGESPH